MSEITKALNGFAAGKTPGPDGLPKEFYAKFWEILGPHLLDLNNFSFPVFPNPCSLVSPD